MANKHVTAMKEACTGKISTTTYFEIHYGIYVSHLAEEELTGMYR